MKITNEQLNWISWSTLALSLVIGAWLLASPSISTEPNGELSENIRNSSLDRMVIDGREVPVGHRSIENLRVGDRVLARNPEVSQEQREAFVEPDWSQCLKLSLEMPKQDGQILHIEMIRSEEWFLENCIHQLQLAESPEPLEEQSLETIIEEQLEKRSDASELLNELSQNWTTENANNDLTGIGPLRSWRLEQLIAKRKTAAGGYIYAGMAVNLDLPELGAAGLAEVKSVKVCPEIQHSAGNVITSTFRHPPSANVLDVRFEGESDTIGVTDNHLFWSVNEQAFIPIGQMEVGELIQTHNGETKRIESMLARPGPESVYNIEVWGEHVYFVGQQGTLAHNMCQLDDLADILLDLPTFSIIDDASGAGGRATLKNTVEAATVTHKVIAEVRVGGVNKSFFDFNGTLRNFLEGSRTSVLGEILSNRLLRVLTDNSNATLGQLTTGVHAEIGGLLQTAFELGGRTGENGLKGADVVITVTGTNSVCSKCLGQVESSIRASIGEVASQLKVNSLTVRDAVSGQTFVLRPGGFLESVAKLP